MPPRIALIHALATAIPPIRHAFNEGWPEATLSNLLDDDLMPAYTREGGLTPHIVERICSLALYAARTGVDGILFTCSVFPQAEDMAKQLVRVPLLKPDEAMISAALDAPDFHARQRFMFGAGSRERSVHLACTGSFPLRS